MDEKKSKYLDNQSLAAYAANLFKYRKTGAVLLFISLVSAVVWLRIQTPLYNINLVLSPAEILGESGSNRTQGAISNMFKIRGNQTDREMGRILYLLTSERLVIFLKPEIDLVEKIFGPAQSRGQEGWASRSIRSLTGEPGPREASTVNVAGWLQRNIRIREVQDTDLTEVTLLHENPEQGKKLILTLYGGANEILRSEALTQTRSRVDYLRDLISQIAVSEYRDSLLNLLMEQEKKSMLLQVGSSYGAEILDGPRASSAPVFPNYTLTIIMALFFAVIATITIVVLISWIKDMRRALPITSD